LASVHSARRTLDHTQKRKKVQKKIMPPGDWYKAVYGVGVMKSKKKYSHRNLVAKMDFLRFFCRNMLLLLHLQVRTVHPVH